jgi:hypothetical protein
MRETVCAGNDDGQVLCPKTLCIPMKTKSAEFAPACSCFFFQLRKFGKLTNPMALQIN